MKQSKRIPFQVKPGDHMQRERTVKYPALDGFPCMRLLVLNVDKGISLAERERGGKEGGRHCSVSIGLGGIHKQVGPVLLSAPSATLYISPVTVHSPLFSSFANSQSHELQKDKRASFVCKC